MFLLNFLRPGPRRRRRRRADIFAPLFLYLLLEVNLFFSYILKIREEGDNILSARGVPKS